MKESEFNEKRMEIELERTRIELDILKLEFEQRKQQSETDRHHLKQQSETDRHHLKAGLVEDSRRNIEICLKVLAACSDDKIMTETQKRIVTYLEVMDNVVKLNK